MELENKKINFLGDSITLGVGTSEESAGFVNLIAKKENALCRNYGISGTRIARQHSSNELHDIHYFGSRVQDMDEDADIIVVFGGTNDYGHGDAEIGNMSDRTDDTFYGALHNLCISLIRKYPKAEIVFLTPLHRFDEKQEKNGRIVELRDYIQIIRQVTEYYSIPVLDMYAIGRMNPIVDVLREMYMPDGVHPNDAGHEIIANRIVSFLKKI